MGTRAYRERERREFEREKEVGMTRVLADNVRVEMGIELLGEEGKGKEMGKEGVVVKTSLLRREEDA
jgi:hypothetical protein